MVLKEINLIKGISRLVPYYLNGRITKTSFYLLNCCLLFIALLIVLIPIIYFILFPAFLQSCVDNIGTSGNSVRVYNQSVNKMTRNSVDFHGELRINRWTIFPLPGGFGENVVEITTMSGDRLASVKVPEAAFMLNEEIKLDAWGSISLDLEQEKNLHDLLKKLSTTGLDDDFGLVVNLNAPIKSNGITVYSSLPLKRVIPIGKVHASEVLKSLIPNPSLPQPKAQFHAFEFKPRPDDNGAALRGNFKEEGIVLVYIRYHEITRGFGRS